MKGTMTMNEYGRQALEYWQTYRPAAYAALEDPVVFFTNLGEQIEQQVHDASTKLAGPDRADEGYLEKVARLRTARITAEELVLQDLLFLPPAPTTDATELPVTAPRETSPAHRAHVPAPSAVSMWGSDDHAAGAMLPEEFLLSLANAEHPWTVLDSPTWAQARKDAAVRRLQQWQANAENPSDPNA